MSKPFPAPAIPTFAPARPWFCPTVWLKPYLTPYYIAVAAVLGAITAGFAVLVTVLIIIALNINVLGLIE